MKLKEHLLTILVTVIIIILSILSIPEKTPMSDFPLIDKWVHMVMYGGLAFIMWFDYVVRSGKVMSRNCVLWMVLYPIVLGGLMELVQAFFTTCRSGDWIDFEADAIGTAIGVGLSLLANKLWTEKISGRN